MIAPRSDRVARGLRLAAAIALAGVAALCGEEARAQAAPANPPDFKTAVSLGERFEAAGKHRQAAEQFALAYDAKKRKEEYAARAAELFYLVKDYERAARYFAAVESDKGEYPLAGLKRARSLKQLGDFDRAASAYLTYLEDYRRDDREVIRAIVEQEVKGIALAREEATRARAERVVVEQLGAGVNGSANDFAPMPLAPGTVYYLSDRAGLARMYRSDARGPVWTPGELARQFPAVPGKHVGSGALSPLGDRFYVTLCEATAVMSQPTAPCQLYVVVRRDSAWSKPRALPAYVNTPGNATAHPYAYRDGDVEVLLFSSDRLDGYGGMDLYRAERYLDSEATDFTFPQNLGPVVNSVADEVTPFYEPRSQTLYFASNGYVGLGGYDVFETRGRDLSWNEPSNLLSPVNTPADDYYYRRVPGSERAFLSSNRVLAAGKARSSHEDVFLVRPGTPTVEVNLQVVDSASSQALGEVALAVFELGGDGSSRKLVASEMSPDGFFTLALPMGAQLELDVQRLDYRRRVEYVTVPKNQREGYQLPRIRLGRIALPLSEVQRVEAARTGAPRATLPSRSAGDATPPPEPTRPRVLDEGTSYRVQVEARRDFDGGHARYDGLRAYGPLTSDYVAAKGLYRVLVGSFAAREEAERAARGIRAGGWGNAFVARFEGRDYRGRVR